MERKKIVHLHTLEKNKPPRNDQLNYGEIAINYNHESEKLYIKNDINEIVGFYSEKAIDANTNVINNNFATLNQNKQNKTDDTLSTTDKTIVGAINENNDYILNLLYNYIFNINDFSGHLDWQGLKSIGWSNEDIRYFKKYGINWEEEEDSFNTVPQENINLMPMSIDKIADSKNIIKYLPMFDCSNINNLNSKFYGCSKMISIPRLDTSKVTNMSTAFSSCSNLLCIPKLNTSRVTNMSDMFNGCSNLIYVPELDTSKVEDMTNMFYNCSNLKKLPNFDTSQVNTMNGMLNLCSTLKEIPRFNTSNVTNMYGMFNYCIGLQKIPLLNVSNVTNFRNSFNGCSSLSTLEGLVGLKTDVDFKDCPLTKQSIINVFNEAATVIEKTICLGASNLSKLTDEDKTIATNKGWILT